MTMQQAFECGDNDIPFIDGEYNDEHTLTKKLILDHYHNLGVKAALSDKWQVKTAEPVVLSAEEMLKRLQITLRDTSSFLHDKCYLEEIKRADKNGQTKEQLRMKPLIESISKYKDGVHSSDFMGFVLKAFCDLKPLNQD